MAASRWHPDLAGLARWLPRSMAPPAITPVLRPLMTLLGTLVSGGERVRVGEADVYVFRPEGPGPHPAMLWMHGGGLVLGDARQDLGFLRKVVEGLGVMVVSVQYRFAPAHPFPAALDDCHGALEWLAAQPDVDPQRIAVGGASAGGGLAAAVCQAARERRRVRPALQLLVYPMLDDRTATRRELDDPGHRMWDRRSNAYGWASYLRGWNRAAPPRFAVPARTEDLSRLPPAWIGVGEVDLFRDEDVAYATRLQAAGVPVQLELVPGAYHGFDAIQPKAAITRAFVASQLDALRRALL